MIRWIVLPDVQGEGVRRVCHFVTYRAHVVTPLVSHGLDLQQRRKWEWLSLFPKNIMVM